MDTGLLLQYLVIALAVLVSAWVVLKKQFPGLLRQLRGALALWLVKRHSLRLQAWGRQLAPPPSSTSGACGGCDGCGPGEPKQH
ncbi:hypothetical protein ARC78_01385 [Stenotrophomonas pictorum JCM 9942]|uniref:Uncharacterized protein n=1 Tax=Stenotrophomonas pictorum JCM 9942 TaxID=1236960 RepID=A0A0R0ACZ5_9GAMM|nr:DUF6587 family protein [Stenotrophomonas pictorum]KRG39399.1 hypothetical protein ARC78_01385 [Stenotrophomonas pictorum JCM 9942]